MVRFSDMLGGGADQEGTRASTVPAPPDRTEPQPEPEPEPELSPEPEAVAAVEPGDADVDASVEAKASETPEEVLDRLTQYASTARATDPGEPGEPQQDLTPVGDDLLPRPKGDTRKHRRK